MTGSAGFRPSVGEPETVTATASGVLLLESLDELAGVSPETRQVWAVTLAADQPAVDYKNLFHVYHALDALALTGIYRDAPPAPPILLDDNDNALHPSGSSLAYLRCSLLWLIRKAEIETSREAARQLHRILDRLESLLDDAGCFPATTALDALVATAFIEPFYAYVYRAMPKARQRAESALAVAAETADAADCDFTIRLALADLLSSSRREVPAVAARAHEILARMHDRIRLEQSADGSFTPVRDAGPQSSPGSRDRDIVSATWLGLCLLRRTDVTVADASSNATAWARRWPGPMYRPPSHRLTVQERKSLAVWLPSASAWRPFSGEPLVSVVITCRNLGRYLSEAIASVQEQTLRELEMIIVDDGSDDEHTVAVIDAYGLQGLRVLRQPAAGLATARNAGIQAARAPYICCLDADDRLRRDCLKTAAAALDADPALGFVSGWMRLFDGVETEVRVDGVAMASMLAFNRAVGISVFRRAAWSRCGGYKGGFSVPGIEDWDFWLSILEAGYGATVIPQVLFDYRIRPGSMSERMYEPDAWRAMVSELVAGHATAYRSHVQEIIAELHARWARERQWALERDQAVSWWKVQAQQQARAAEAATKLATERDAWIEQLKRATEWLEGQKDQWQRVAAERAELLAQQSRWISELQLAKAWLEEQRDRWQQIATRTSEDADRSR